MIALECSSCGKSLKVKDELAGKKVKCPGCQKPVSVPQPAASVSPSPASPADERTLPPKAHSPGEKRILPPKDAGKKESISDADGHTNLGAEQAESTQAFSAAGHNSELTDFLAPPQHPDELGRLGGFRILKILGHGGMGIVFQGEDPILGRKVAIKAMLPHLAGSKSSHERFLREAKAAAALEHDHIVPIFHVAVDCGAPFIVMPFLQGEPLDERLKQEKILPVAEVLRIGREAAEGLAAAHKRSLIHRDIKPANLWLEGDKRRVKILDFGLARAAEDSHLTQSGAIIGTPAYMAPEQANAKPVDGRCDLFSLGCVLYRLSTGTLPFKGEDTLSTLMAIASETPPSPCEVNPAVPRKVSDLVMNLLAKDPDKRPASAEAVAGLLANLEKEPLVEPPPKVRKHKYVCLSCRAPVAAAQPIPEGTKTKCPKCGKVVALRPADLEEEKVLAFEVDVLDEDAADTHEVRKEKSKEPKPTAKLPKKGASSGRKYASRSSGASLPLWVPATIVGALLIATGVGFYLSSQRGVTRFGPGQVAQSADGSGSDGTNAKGLKNNDPKSDGAVLAVTDPRSPPAEKPAPQVPVGKEIEQPNGNQELQNLRARFRDAHLQRAKAFLEVHLADEFKHTFAQKQEFTKKEFIAALLDPKFVIKSYRLATEKISVEGDKAVATGQVTIEGRADKLDLTGTYQEDSTYVRREGRWQCVTYKTMPSPIGKPPVSLGGTDREVGEWALDNGGKIVLRTADGKPAEFTKKNEPPQLWRECWSKPFKLTGIVIRGDKIVDADIVKVSGLAELEAIFLESPALTDACLIYLKGLSKLRNLALRKGTFGDSSVEEVVKFADLLFLHMPNSKISDIGLSHLKKLKNLVHLDLNDTQISDAGLAHLQGLPMRALHVGGTRVTDGGLAYVKNFKLEQLELRQTGVTDASLPVLREQKALIYLGLRETGISAAAAGELKKALPKCNIAR